MSIPQSQTQSQFAGQVTQLVNNPAPAPTTSPAITPTVTPAPASAPAGNPNSRGVNDVSDIRPTSVIINLPIRGDKQIIPTQIDASLIEQSYQSGPGQLGQILGITQSNFIKDSDFYVYAKSQARRLQNGVDFIKIRIPHRGVNPSSLLPDPTQAVEYRFLTNPNTLTVNRQTVDAQSLTRGGWQFGVWGEDTFLVQMQGTSAGTFFTNGTTDELSYYSVSYRNLMQLQQVFENNGYWFEGEEYNEGPLAAGYLRRRIRMHQDVELWCGNFIWFGMFDGFTISQDANNPFLLNFSLSFFVWKEKYRSGSPYWGSIENNVQRGHSYSVVEGSSASIPTNNSLAQYAPSAVASQSTQMTSALSTSTNSPYSNNPAVKSCIADDLMPPTPSLVSDTIGVQPLSQLTSPASNAAFWKF